MTLINSCDMNTHDNLIKFIQFFDMHARVACENSPAFIPTSKRELNSAFKVINDSMQDDLPQKLRNIWMKWVVSFDLIIESRVARTQTITVMDISFTNSFWRFWTDYEQSNETHFWSNIASSWWSKKDDESEIHYYGDYFKFKSRGWFLADFFDDIKKKWYHDMLK